MIDRSILMGPEQRMGGGDYDVVRWPQIPLAFSDWEWSEGEKRKEHKTMIERCDPSEKNVWGKVVGRAMEMTGWGHAFFWIIYERDSSKLGLRFVYLKHDFDLK